jgi:hypothetical protein
MAIAMSGVFEERFLINFCLPPGILSVGDMMLVDSLLERKTKLMFGEVASGGQKDEVEEIHPGDTSNKVEECSESPEATRHFKKDENDLIDFNQRRRSIFHNPDKEINFHNHGADMTFDINLGLSPILRENLSNTIDGNYDRMCTTFNTFGSPNWLDNYEGEKKDKPNTDDEQNLPDFNDYDPAYESENIQEELPEFCPNLLENLSINSQNSDGYTPDKTKLSRKSREKRHKLKQTTVTFYYDSDEEIKDTCDDSDSPIDVRINLLNISVNIRVFKSVHWNKITCICTFYYMTSLRTKYMCAWLFCIHIYTFIYIYIYIYTYTAQIYKCMIYTQIKLYAYSLFTI